MVFCKSRAVAAASHLLLGIADATGQATSGQTLELLPRERLFQPRIADPTAAYVIYLNAIDIKSRQEFGWNIDYNVQIGIVIRGWKRRECDSLLNATGGTRIKDSFIPDRRMISIWSLGLILDAF